MQGFAHQLTHLEPISLNELGAARLMNRVDTKFIIPLPALTALLTSVAGQYRVLDINNTRAFRYVTRYYDTANLLLYEQHHNHRAARAKIRTRTYVNTGASFLEVKNRLNTGQTMKKRKAWEAQPLSHADLASLLTVRVPFHTGDELVPITDSTYTRTTLVATSEVERVTIDTDLTFIRTGQTVQLKRVAIVEIKQARKSVRSPAWQSLLRQGLRPQSFSKYCMSVALLFAHARRNRFLPTLRRIAPYVHGSSDVRSR